MPDKNLKDNKQDELKKEEKKENQVEKKEVNNEESIVEPKGSFNFDVLKNKKIFGNFSSFFKKKKVVDNLDLLETNLIKDEIEIIYDWKKDLSIFFVLFLVVAVFVAESYIFLYNWKKQKEVENSYYLETEITATELKINSLKDQYAKAMEFKSRLELSSVVLSNHVYWTNFFNFLEKNTLKDNVYYRNFSGDVYGNYILPAVSNDVLAVNFQSKVFSDNPNIISSSINEEEIVNDENTGKTHINFNFNFNLNPKIFTN
jgi:hypothetical protein